jgi:vanillate O-demethylase monooxygenase subunit
MSFLHNTWYMLAWAGEVGERPLARTVIGIPLVVFRDPRSQRLVALHDRCPHRFAPLSMGRLVDGNIECPYHGLQFNTEGRCVLNPFSSAAPAAAKVRTFAVEERDMAVWVWMGEPAQADAAKIPHLPHHRRGDRMVTGYTATRADYRLFCDNLMDPTHAAFVHPGIGGPTYRPKVKTWEESNGDIVAEFAIERMANVFGEEIIAGAEVRHCDTMRWMAPSVHYLESRTGPVGTDEVLIEVLSAHVLTPETATTSHYFWSSTAPGATPDDALREVLRQAFDGEDKPMIEAVQQRMGGAELWDLKPVLLPADAGGVRVRRRLAALIEAEQPPSAAAAH